MTLSGIDISFAQATTPALGGYAFVIVKATQANFVDPRWIQHSAAVRAAGKPLGAYCFGVSSSRTPVAQQAALFLATAKDADFLVLDLERDTKWPSSMTGTEAQAFLAAVHAAGRPIGLYHSRSGFPSLGQDWNWVADYTGTQPVMPWVFWQYTSTPIDHDKFDGDEAALAAFLASQGGSMAQKPITDTTPKLIDWLAGTPYFDVDGTTQIGKTGSPTVNRASPYGAGTQRAFYAGAVPSAKLALITPSAVHDVPKPVVPKPLPPYAPGIYEVK